MNKGKKNNSTLLIGGLTSTAGLFITKAIGLLYIVPFRTMVGPENYVYYAAGYELYDLILTISLAGLPFAIASIVSKYMEKQDYKTVILLKKISHGLLGVFGFIGATAVWLFINPIISTRGIVSGQQLLIYRNVYLLMSLSIFTVPLLSSYRGFFQGIKDFKSYSLSQIIEQVSRVSFLLGLGALSIYVFKSDQIWGIYFALIATAISAVTAILYLAVYKNDQTKTIIAMAKAQDKQAVEVSLLLSELFKFSIPYLFSIILSNRFGFSNMFLLPRSLQSFGYDIKTSQLYTSLITNETAKLMSIPNILAVGFSIAIIPQISEALVRNDHQAIQKDISLSIESVLYIGLPVLCAMFFLSEEVYFALFGGNSQLVMMGGQVLKAQVVVAVLGNLVPVTNALAMTLNLRRQVLMILLVAFILNFVFLKFFISSFGWLGAMYTIFITTALVVIYSLYIIAKKQAISYKYTFRKIFLMIIGLIAMSGVYGLLRFLNLKTLTYGRFLGLFPLAIYGFLMILAYVIVTNLFYLPQSILNIDFKKLFLRVIKR